MKIGIDARPLTVPTFGIGRYTRELISRLVQLPGNHQWYLYADRPLLIDPLHNVTVRQFHEHQPIMSLLRTQVTFAHWAQLDKLDVFWSPRHHLPICLEIPQVVTIHDIVWKKFPNTMQKANRFIESLLMPPSLKRATSVIAVSEATKADLIAEFKIAPEKIQVIYEAAAELTLPKNTASESEGDYYLFVGTNEPRKNLNRLLQAHAGYLDRGGTKELLIVGSAGWGDQAKPQSGCKMLGYVDDARLDSLLRDAYALVMPSLYEGFGLPLLEAIQRGVPVITGNVSAMPEIAGQAGLLVNPMRVEEISAAMTEMAKPSIRANLQRHCQTQAQKFSWDSAASQTLRVINDAVG